MNAVVAVFHRDFRQRITNIGFIFWDLMAPLAYLALFGTGFERAMGGGFVVDGREIGYATFLLAGVLAMTGFSVAMNTSWTFFMDKDSGIFYELLTYPITRSQFLVGKVCFNVLMSIIGCLIAILFGVMVLDIPVRWPYIPLTLLIALLTTAGWFYWFALFSVRMKRMDDFNTVTSACYLFFMFFSTMFYPIDNMPSWFRAVSLLNPMTWQVDLLRWTLLGIGEPMALAAKAVAFAAFGFLFLKLAARALDRAA
jgi:ABC-2 type transport system permease protein